SQSLGSLTRASDRGAVSPAELAEIRAVLDRVPALAWGDASVGKGTPVPARVAAQRGAHLRAPSTLEPVRIPLGPAKSDDPGPCAPLTVLVVGPQQIADALLH